MNRQQRRAAVRTCKREGHLMKWIPDPADEHFRVLHCVRCGEPVKRERYSSAAPQ